MKLLWAPDMFKRLNGVFCVYKPTGVPISQVVHIIKHNLLRGLNALPCYEYEREGSKTLANNDSTLLALSTVPANMKYLSDHRLVLGDRFIESDIQIDFLHGLSKHSSGVQVMSVGPRNKRWLGLLSRPMFLRVYHVKGRFGMATDNFSPKGKIIERTRFHHITKAKLDKVCCASQSGHQRLMFEYAGVDPCSQEAYDLAVTGLVRPASRDTPSLLYGVKCIDFNPPDFILEVHSINESMAYFSNLVHEIGLELKSTAVCTHIHRVRLGHVTLPYTLLKSEWNLESILKNIDVCRRELMAPEKLQTNLNISDTKTDSQADTSVNQQTVASRLDPPSTEDILKRLYNKVDK